MQHNVRIMIFTGPFVKDKSFRAWFPFAAKEQRQREMKTKEREGGIMVDYQPRSSGPAPLLFLSFHPPLLPLSSITALISPANWIPPQNLPKQLHKIGLRAETSTCCSSKKSACLCAHVCMSARPPLDSWLSFRIWRSVSPSDNIPPKETIKRWSGAAIRLDRDGPKGNKRRRERTKRGGGGLDR